MEPQWKTKARREASQYHMCEEYRTALERSSTKAELVSLYKRCVDWALDEGMPTLTLLREEYTDCGKYGLFIDRTFNGELLCDDTVYIFHNCKGAINIDLNVEKAIIPMLYFANGCEMTIKRLAESQVGTIQVPLYIFGANKIITENTDFVNFKIYKEK